jgi:4a-hydroxytetrahydrobiopterin dehydratase
VATLAGQKCTPCQGGTPPLGTDAQALLHEQLHSDWKIVNGHHLSRTFQFADFVTALDFVNKLGAIAEEEGHHPDLLLSWGSVKTDVWTHKIDGLTESDFILAAKADVAFLTA